MSAYGDSPKGCDKNELYDVIRDFLEKYPISELLEVVTDCIRYEKGK